ncbi:polyamine ABC transporter ATP-binding protein [Sinorhizobium meliloti]|uniref:ABC transporter ATP-binding protein n=1 Tax=Rhizobium meliloti TaxID=382 RepID=UPI0004290368|nr:ABC transporter ATP-binding protein [Sinorhizobium meliloti]MDW9356872.1 polyamine ABC transporter ATP-binding protein [Sinorhizobium meliloti]MDW9414970.1 polyamine ABC transporter ATP-binding protein [Sinorhizobium meliloti]MDW9460056.1 polyamine ABC transporter ATP-binding protein [Sinorhizobium meliloti]MDW9479842.1 polyamine ABC transporter ATP-binding protein [Sinorhizobium meliloti]MDW9510169.1 polyamine ABC transporter ATP-binding protein [Sinorhizobium meliloti]
MGNAFIHFDKVSKAFGAMTVVDKLDLAIEKGEFVSMLGPSGSGKTTLLMMLAGFEAPTSGSISVRGKRVDALPPYRRNMGVVFQNYALFPHMTVAENVAFPLKMRRVSRSEIVDRVGKALDMVQLGAFKDRRPIQLSGGQQQRVALARALVFEPEVVLMDEPLGALDKKLREQMQMDIRDIHHRLGLTIVFVTHDQAEALTMSDRIAIFNHGKIEQIGTPSEIYDRPATQFVAEFIGETNLLSGKVTMFENGLLGVAVEGGQQIKVATSAKYESGKHVKVSVRPERIELGPSDGPRNELKVRVSDVVYRGDHLQVVVDAANGSLVVKSTRKATTPRIGDEAVASFSPEQCWIVA